MNLVEYSETFRIELRDKESISLHLGALSLHMSVEDLKTIHSLFDPKTVDNDTDDKVCSVYKSETGKFVFTYRTVMFSLCGHALSKLSKLIAESVSEYEKLYSTKVRESIEDIESILTEIEEKNNKFSQ